MDRATKSQPSLAAAPPCSPSAETVCAPPVCRRANLGHDRKTEQSAYRWTPGFVNNVPRRIIFNVRVRAKLISLCSIDASNLPLETRAADKLAAGADVTKVNTLRRMHGSLDVESYITESRAIDVASRPMLYLGQTIDTSDTTTRAHTRNACWSKTKLRQEIISEVIELAYPSSEPALGRLAALEKISQHGRCELNRARVTAHAYRFEAVSQLMTSQIASKYLTFAFSYWR